MTPLEFDEYFNEFKKTLENIKSDEKIIHETETSNFMENVGIMNL